MPSIRCGQAAPHGLWGGWTSASWAQRQLLRGGTEELRISSQAGLPRRWNGPRQGHQAAQTRPESSPASQVSFPAVLCPGHSLRFSQDTLRMLLCVLPKTLAGCPSKYWHTQLHLSLPLLCFLLTSLSCSESMACRQCSPPFPLFPNRVITLSLVTSQWKSCFYTPSPNKTWPSSLLQ